MKGTAEVEVIGTPRTVTTIVTGTATVAMATTTGAALEEAVEVGGATKTTTVAATIMMPIAVATTTTREITTKTAIASVTTTTTGTPVRETITVVPNMVSTVGEEVDWMEGGGAGVQLETITAARTGAGRQLLRSQLLITTNSFRNFL